MWLKYSNRCQSFASNFINKYLNHSKKNNFLINQVSAIVFLTAATNLVLAKIQKCNQYVL